MLRSLWCVGILLLAGCTAKESTPEPEPTAATVTGVVVTEAIEPIEGASILLEPVGLAASTDVFGRFRFQDLNPGPYRLLATAPGHTSLTVSLVVEAGQVARPRMVLPSEPSVVVRHETHEFQGFVPAWLGAADDAAAPAKAAIGASCTCAFQVPAPPGLQGITVEAVWQDSIQRQDAGTEFRWNVSMEASTAGAGPSPLHAHVLWQDMSLNGTEVTVSLIPDETWPAYDQSYQLFVTLWQGEEPPEQWSRVRGDA